MKPEFAAPFALDVNGDKKYLLALSVKELISNIRTAFRMADFDSVEKVLEEQQSMLKAEIKELRQKLELETLVRMSVEDKCKERLGRYEILLESVKKNAELDHENTIAELKMKNAELENEKRMLESELESWKMRYEELSQRLLIVGKGKGVNLSMNVDTQGEIGGKAEKVASIQGESNAGLFDEVMGEKDMDVVDICDNAKGNATVGLAPSQRKGLKSGNSPVSAVEVTRQSPDSPNKAVLVASGISAEDTDKPENNEVDMDDHECKNIAANSTSSQGEIHDCGNTNIAVDNDARQSPRSPNSAVLGTSDATTKNASDKYDQECGNTAADTSTLQGLMDDCGSGHVGVDDDARQSLETPNSVLGASDATTKNAINIDDHECGNVAACTSLSQGKTNDGGNIHALDDDFGQSPNNPNTIVLGASDATIENAIDILDHECGTTSSVAPYVTIDDVIRQSPDTSNTVVLGASEATTGEAVDIHDHEFGNTAADISPSERKTNYCENTRDVDDDARQSYTPNTTALGASDNGSLGTQKAVIDINDSDTDDHDEKRVASGTLKGNEATCDNAAAVDDIGHSRIFGLIDSLQRKWFPDSLSANASAGSKKSIIEISDGDDDECIGSGALKEKEEPREAAVDDVGHSSYLGTTLESLKRKRFPEAGNLFDGLNTNLVGDSDTDTDSSSSASSLESGFINVQLPSNFLCSSGGGKQRKT